MRDADVIIIGAGLTGLRAAVEVIEAGLSVLLFESAGHVGGRMSTEFDGGFKLDRGFQVILSAYPELKLIKGFDRLSCRAFSSGARIRWRGEFFDFLDPRRHPEAFLSLLKSPIASFRDLARLFIMTCATPVGLCKGIGQSTEDGLRESGFTQNFRDTFLTPFLRGVLLDPLLRCDYSLSQFYLRMFARGDALLPSAGVQALPNLLVEQIGGSHVRLNSRVNRIKGSEVVLENGESYYAKEVLCAADALSAAQVGASRQTYSHSGVTTLYLSSPSPPFPEPVIVINADRGPIATLAVVSNVQPSYSPPGHSLISISVIGSEAALPQATLYQRVLGEAKEWFGSHVNSWSPVKSFPIPAAVVTRPNLTPGYSRENGILFAGDYLSYPSQNGALLAGRMAGKHIVESLVG